MALHSRASIQVAAVTVDGGLPLFSRSVGDISSLSLADTGSLYSCGMFTEEKGAQLTRTETATTRTMWKSYFDSVLMMMITSHDKAELVHTHRLLDLMSLALVLILGLEELQDGSAKKTLRINFRNKSAQINRFLDTLAAPGDFMGPLVGAADITLIPEGDLKELTDKIESFAYNVESNYGFVLLGGKIVAGTESFWTLSAEDLVILTAYVRALQHATARDVLIYLPDASPLSPLRLLTFMLYQKVEICVLCSEVPSLPDAINALESTWGSAESTLKGLQLVSEATIPTALYLNPDIICFLVLNRGKRISHTFMKPVGSVIDPFAQVSEESHDGNYFQVLLTWYRTVSGSCFPTAAADSIPTLTKETQDQITDTYVCATEHKAYALQRGEWQLFAIFNTRTPTFALRQQSHDILDTILPLMPV